MTETLSVPYGYVTGRYVLVAGDTSADSDPYPDATPATGTVTFTPSVLIQYVESTPPVTGILMPVVCQLDVNGFIVDDAGNAGVWLMAGVYKVSFQLVGSPLPAFLISVTADNTTTAPLDLTLAAPLQPTPITTFVVNEQVYQDTLAARDAAMAAAAAAQQLGILTIDQPIPAGWASRLILREAS